VCLAGCGDDTAREAELDEGSADGPDQATDLHTVDADGTDASPGDTVSIATLNVLHGIGCADGDHCRLSDRIDLVFDWIRRSDCPDIVALQEVSFEVDLAVRSRIESACDFPYRIVYEPSALQIDDEMILSRYPAVEHELVPLHRDFRHALYARIEHPVGLVDVLATHLASGSDNGDCGSACPAPCTRLGAASVRDCQAVQLVESVTDHEGARVSIVLGDMNVEPTDWAYSYWQTLGWIDSYLEAGGPECEPDTGLGCTSGRSDEGLSALESVADNEDRRIDFLLLAGMSDCEVADASHWADLPNPFADDCGGLPEAICWPSDHKGVEAILRCP